MTPVALVDFVPYCLSESDLLADTIEEHGSKMI